MSLNIYILARSYMWVCHNFTSIVSIYSTRRKVRKERKTRTERTERTADDIYALSWFGWCPPPLLLLFWGVIICFGLLGSFTPPKRKYPQRSHTRCMYLHVFLVAVCFVCLRPVHMCFNFCLLSFHNTTIKKKNCNTCALFFLLFLG